MPELNRHTARVLLFDHEDRILLFLTIAPDTSGIARWITPGGGVDPGESAEQGAIRELYEETGLSVATLVGPVWSHDFRVQWDAADHDTGHADFFTHLTDRFEPSSENWTDEERTDVLESRWWSLAELLAERPLFEPAELIDLIRRQLPSCQA